jgi:tRNA threonylcarbamoyladenosine biosynthesis protein TsaE
VTAQVTSPTFVLEKIYELSPTQSAFARLVHIDAYRLEGGAALSPLGFAELMLDPATLVLLEWPERVADVLPEPACAISLAVAPEGGRIISYTYA